MQIKQKVSQSVLTRKKLNNLICLIDLLKMFKPIINSVNFVQVNYDELRLREYAKVIIKRNIRSNSIIKWQLLARQSMYLFISYKDKFFMEEGETRAVITLEERFKTSTF